MVVSSSVIDAIVSSTSVFDRPSGACGSHVASMSSHEGVDFIGDDGLCASTRDKEERWEGALRLADLSSMAEIRREMAVVMQNRVWVF